MAIRRYGKVKPNAPVVNSVTAKGSGTIYFGKLLAQTATEGTVQLTSGSGSPVFGLALPNAVVKDNNTTATVTGTGADFFSTDAPIGVEPLVKGQDYWVCCGASGNVAINTYLVAASSGNVVNSSSTTTPSVYTIGVALEAGTGSIDNGWFKMRAL